MAKSITKWTILEVVFKNVKSCCNKKSSVLNYY